MFGTYVAVMGGELNVKEKIFMAIAWLPKATVQAALGPIFLDNVLRFPEEKFDLLADPSRNMTTTEIKEEWVAMGNDILTLAVLSILITAPLGAVSILGFGPRLLEQDENFKTSEDEEGTEEDIEEMKRAIPSLDEKSQQINGIVKE